MMDDSNELVSLDLLKRWEEKGYEIVLATTHDGQWSLSIGTPGRFIRPPISPLDRHEDAHFYYMSPPCKTPQEAIRVAMQVVRL